MQYDVSVSYLCVCVLLVTAFVWQGYCPLFLSKKRDCSERGMSVLLVLSDMLRQITTLVSYYVIFFCTIRYNGNAMQ